MSAAVQTAPAVEARPGLDELLAPIPGDRPAGESLRYDPIHDEIRELRRRDDPTLPQGVWQHELKKADWNGLARVAAEALRERSKDLLMAVWLTEAWTRRDGLDGLVRGVELAIGLIELYGPDLHPREEPEGPAEPAEAAEREDDPALRLAALGRLESCLAEALLHLPVTRPRTDDGEVLVWGDWKRALYLENLGASHPEAASKAGGVTRERFLANVGLTPDGFYGPLVARTEACRAALERLAALADERYGRDAPAFGPVREELEEIGRLARRLTAERGEQVPSDPAADGGEETQMSEPQTPDTPDAPTGSIDPAAPGETLGAITTREEAYRALDRAAELLLRVEPHSPVPYLVKRAVRWGGLSLSELYGELFQIADPNIVFRLLGIQQKEPGE